MMIFSKNTEKYKISFVKSSKQCILWEKSRFLSPLGFLNSYVCYKVSFFNDMLMTMLYGGKLPAGSDGYNTFEVQFFKTLMA